MNLTEMYLSSPDWLKLTWTLAPWITVYGIARIWGRVQHIRYSSPKMPEADWVKVEKVEWE